MVITILAVGKIKSPALAHACDEYVRRFRRRSRLEIVEVRAGGQGQLAPADCRAVEGDRLLKIVTPTSRVVALSRDGEMDSSEGFARRMQQWREDARDVTMVIGGAFGLDPRVLGRAEYIMALSTMTMAHDLARLVLLEQLYRADTIIRGEPYHKGRT